MTDPSEMIGTVRGAPRDATEGADLHGETSPGVRAGDELAERADLPDAHADYEQVQDRLRSIQEAADRHSADVARLNEELASLLAQLERSNAEVEALRVEAEVVRVVSAKSRNSTPLPWVHPTARRPSLWHAVLTFIEQTLSTISRNWHYKIRRAAQLEAIRKSGLFDTDWYLQRYPDIANAGVDPVSHYVDFGGWEGREANPLFDSEWYRRTYPDVLKTELTAFGHFVCIGLEKGYDPNPLFHTAWYVAQNPGAATDAPNPLRHYLEHGCKERHNPNPLFDSAWYLRQNPDVAAAGMNPLSHYIQHGIAEMRDPHPLFDTQWYMQRYDDVAVSGMDALEHYLTIGAINGHRTSPPRDGMGQRESGQFASMYERRELEALDNDDDAVIADAETLDSPSPTETGRWQMSLKKKRPAVPHFTGEIGVFVHLFYEDLAWEIAAGLLAIPYPFKVFASTNSDEKRVIIESAFNAFGISVVVKVLPNRGWDIAPFVVGFRDEIRMFDICLKLHGKRSRHGPRGEKGTAWRKHLLSGLLGTTVNVRYIVDSFTAHPELGVVMTSHWRGVARRVNMIGANYKQMRRLLRRADLSISPDQQIEFPSGSMFWFRRTAIEPLLDLGLTWSDFNNCRSRDVDGTIAHAIERSIIIFAAKAGFKWAVLPRSWIRQFWKPHKLGLRGRRRPERARETGG